ncbi:hypothetical protein GCM10009106_02490 [Sphingomonas japonica]
MRKRDGKRQQLGQFWLWQRPDSGTWNICWLERRGTGRDVTRRKATTVRGGAPDQPPSAAKDALAAHYLENSNPVRVSKDEALVEDIMADWLKYHVASLAAPDRYAVSVVHWINFFDNERKAGRLGSAALVTDLTPALQARFRAERSKSGAGGHTISRDLSALRGALNWAWKNQRLAHAPFIADVAPQNKAPARSRVLTFQEIAAMLSHCAGRPEREHLIAFIVVELGTAGRPEAVLELTDQNIDLKNNLIFLNGVGKVHTRKRRPVIPIARHVLPWVTGIEGKLIKYRVPIAQRNRTANGPTWFERETRSVKTVWNAVCAEAGVRGATPKTLRHTMLTWLACRGVPKEQRMALAGHAAQDTTARNYEHLSPAYLTAAIQEIDAFFEMLTAHTKVHLRYANDTDPDESLAIEQFGEAISITNSTRTGGGAEGNRTPDLCSAIAALSHLSYSPAPARRRRKPAI